MGTSTWLKRMAAGEPLVLDGATGTELERRGIRSALPLWSAHALLEAPESVAQIHADYVAAGADLLTANSFRTQRRALGRGGHAERAAELTALAVDLARQAAAAAPRPVAVLGSAPPLEDCFAPERVPDGAALTAEHSEHAGHLAAAGVDGILIETMNSIREARAALAAANRHSLPALVSFVCWRGPSLLSGESLADAIDAVAEHAPLAVLVNCLPVSNVSACLATLRGSGVPFGVYPNMGRPLDEPGDAAVVRHAEDVPPSALANHAREWLAAGATLVGGCCGTTPAHTARLAQLVRN